MWRLLVSQRKVWCWLYIAWIKQYNGANHFITNEDDGNMFCENSLKWIVSAKNGVHKFGIDVKHKTHYIFDIKASQLCESKHEHLSTKNDVVFSWSIYLWFHKFPICIGVGDFTILGHDNHMYSHNHYLDKTKHINLFFWGTQHIIRTKFVVYH